MNRLSCLLAVGSLTTFSASAGPEEVVTRVTSVVQTSDRLVAEGKEPGLTDEIRVLQSRIQFLERANHQYQQQLNQLHAENNRLAAQLREALALRPAAQEPAAVAQTQVALEAAKREVTQLTQRTSDLELELAKTPNPEAAKQNVKILEETRKNLTEALDTAERLRRQNEALRTPQPAPSTNFTALNEALQQELVTTRAALQTAQLELANQATNTVVTASPGRLRAVDAARFALANNRVPEALTLLREEVRRSPDSAEAWYLLGHSLGLSSDFTSAEAALKKALELSPSSGVTHFELARVNHQRQPADHGMPRWYYHKAVALGYPRDAAFERAIGWEQPEN